MLIYIYVRVCVCGYIHKIILYLRIQYTNKMHIYNKMHVLLSTVSYMFRHLLH
jgi:hypothetical protein